MEKADFAARQKGPESRKNELKLRPPLCHPLKHSITSEKIEFHGPNVSVICDGMGHITKIQIASCPSKKDFDTECDPAKVPPYNGNDLLEQAQTRGHEGRA